MRIWPDANSPLCGCVECLYLQGYEMTGRGPAALGGEFLAAAVKKHLAVIREHLNARRHVEEDEAARKKRWAKNQKKGF